MKRIFLPILLLVFFVILPKKAYAAVLFQDNFENGTSNWIVNTGNWNIINGKYGALVSTPSTIVKTTAILDITTPNYTIDLDLFPVQGTDKNIDFRFGSSTGTYEVHFSGGGASNNFGLPGLYYNLENHPLSDNHPYHVKIILQDQHFQFFVNSDLLFDKTDTNYHFNGHEQFALFVGTGSVYPSEVYFDNIVISTDNSVGSLLSVPLLKQTDPLWANDIYDSAPVWQTNGGDTIGRLGCALTSAAMVFRYFGLTKMPDGVTDLNPGSLNDWMNSVQDRNFRNGATNWQSFSKNLSPLLASANNASFDSLELEYINHQDNTILDNHLLNNLPVILNVPGHFVVAKGKDAQGNSYFINDPAFDRTELTSYNNSYLSSITYIPSHSDLSYLIFAVDPDVDIQLLNDQNQPVGEVSTLNPIDDELNLSANLVGPLKILALPKPDSGNYKLIIRSNSNKSYRLDSYLYDSGSGKKLFNNLGVISSENEDIYHINFDKTNASQSSITEDVSLKSLRNDAKALNDLGHFNKEFYNELVNKINEIESNNSKEHNNTRNKLKELYNEIEKGIKVDAYGVQILLDDIQLLLDS